MVGWFGKMGEDLLGGVYDTMVSFSVLLAF
jgi:hypothetical protein